MSYKDMTKVEWSKKNSNTGAVYFNVLEAELGVTAESDTYIFPIQAMYSIALNLIGDGTVKFTNDPPSIIELGSANWIDWDGVSQVNLGVTGVKLAAVSGVSSLRITVKTQDM